MENLIDHNLAEQIVYAVKEICGYNINFIDNTGIVYASTDQARVGSFHEIGREVALQKQKIEVYVDDSYTGTKKGINIPIFYDEEVVSIIGISGDPERVRKYGYLAERITNLLIQEKNLQKTSLDEREQIHFLLTSLTQGNNLGSETIKHMLKEHNLALHSSFRVVLFHLNSQDPDINVAFFEQEIKNYFGKETLPLLTYNYPNDYVALINPHLFQELGAAFKQFADMYQGKLRLAVGNRCLLLQCNESYRTARIALATTNYQENYCDFSDLLLEILFAKLSDKQKALYRNKVLGHELKPEELHVLQVYFQCDMSLQKTAERLYIHKNTLQYQLKNIEKKTGHDPRKFREAALLYLALSLNPPQECLD